MFCLWPVKFAWVDAVCLSHVTYSILYQVIHSCNHVMSLVLMLSFYHDVIKLTKRAVQNIDNKSLATSFYLCSDKTSYLMYAIGTMLFCVVVYRLMKFNYSRDRNMSLQHWNDELWTNFIDYFIHVNIYVLDKQPESTICMPTHE